MRKRERDALFRALAEIRLGMHYMSADGDNWDKGWIALSRGRQIVAALVGDSDLVQSLQDSLTAHEQIQLAPAINVFDILRGQ